uniref:Retrovirus-related Gag polyprotein from transposon gypsy n=1 Tax=Bactrocera latifrons TaxID=174628 RepID=A0A0K8WM53_BACLA
MNETQLTQIVNAAVTAALGVQRREFENRLKVMQDQINNLSQKPTTTTYEKIKIVAGRTCEESVDVVKSLPEFSGQTEGYVSWREAAHNAYQIFKDYDGSSRHYQAVTIIRNKIRGAADALLSSFSTVLNFNAIIARLDFTYSDKRPIYLVEQELSTLRQGSSTVLEFYDEVEKKLSLLANKTKMSHEESIAVAINEKYRANALSVFISGLRKPLCDILFASQPSDLPSALALAQEVDANHERYVFAAIFANKASDVTKKTESCQRAKDNNNQIMLNRTNSDNQKNPHFVRQHRGDNQNNGQYRQQNFQQNRQTGYRNSQPRQEPMDVDPLHSHLRQFKSNVRDDGGQKRQVASDRRTGPKLQKVNNLKEDRNTELSSDSYEELSEPVVEDLEAEEVNFLGVSPSYPVFLSH